MSKELCKWCNVSLDKHIQYDCSKPVCGLWGQLVTLPNQFLQRSEK